MLLLFFFWSFILTKLNLGRFAAAQPQFRGISRAAPCGLAASLRPFQAPLSGNPRAPSGSACAAWAQKALKKNNNNNKTI